MNRQQFFEWMADPASMNEAGMTDLESLLQEFPYFQTARMLHVISLKRFGDHRLGRELRLAAALAADRSRLKEWLELPGEGPATAPVNTRTAADLIRENQLRQLEEQIRSSLHEIEQKKLLLKDLIDEKNSMMGISGKESPPPESGPAFRPLPKDRMLEEFLEQAGEAAQSKPVFFNPEEYAKKSIEENEDILSETLARLVAAQGKKDKAIKIYQKLMLKYPQKSNTFAAQIEKLKKEL